MDLAKSNPRESARILIVEDDETQAEILQHGLVKAGFRVEVVISGLAAVRMVEDGHFDVLLVDYNILDIDGLATARLLGEFLGPIARPVLIALTATPENLAVRESGQASAFDLVLDKACDLSFVISAIRGCLETAPDQATKLAARDAIYDQAEEEYVMGPDRAGTFGDNPGPARILVVEDDESQQQLLRSILEKRGYVVEVISNGLEAIRRICQNACDLAIVDYNLPEIDGMAVGALVHDQMAQAWRPRLIALTATPELLRGRVMATGPIFDKIVDKSDSLHELLYAVDYLLRLSPNPETRRAAAHIMPLDCGPAPAFM